MKILLVLMVVLVASQATPIEPELNPEEHVNIKAQLKPENISVDDKEKLLLETKVPENSETDEFALEHEPEMEIDSFEAETAITTNRNRHLILLKYRLQDIIQSLEKHIEDEDIEELEEEEEEEKEEKEKDSLEHLV